MYKITIGINEMHKSFNKSGRKLEANKIQDEIPYHWIFYLQRNLAMVSAPRIRFMVRVMNIAACSSWTSARASFNHNGINHHKFFFIDLVLGVALYIGWDLWVIVLRLWNEIHDRWLRKEYKASERRSLVETG